MKSGLYLLLDLHNGGVLYAAKDREMLAGLLACLRDTISFPLFSEIWPRQYSAYNFEDEMLFLSPQDRRFYPMPTNLVTEHFLARRKVAAAKATYIRGLQLLCQAARDTTTLGVPDVIYSDLEAELRNSDSAKGIYTPAIEEYAALLNVSPEACVHELRMKVESGRLIRIRNLAIYQKYLDRIAASSIEDLKTFFDDLNKELFLNSHV